MFCINIIKGLYNSPSELLRDPAALGHSIFDSSDPTVTLLRIVVACIDDDHTIRHSREQIGR